MKVLSTTPARIPGVLEICSGGFVNDISPCSFQLLEQIHSAETRIENVNIVTSSDDYQADILTDGEPGGRRDDLSRNERGRLVCMHAEYSPRPKVSIARSRRFAAVRCF